MITKSLFICCLFLVPICSLAFGEKGGVSQAQFLDFMAKGLLENKDHCPDVDELSQTQRKDLFDLGRQIMADEAGFRKELQDKLTQLNKRAILKKLEACPDEIAARGLQHCYMVKDGSSKVVDFSVGGYDHAGINCTKIQMKAPSAAPSQNKVGT